MNISLLFPGQGSQFIGMGADLFEARPDLLVHAADDVLGWSLRDLCLDSSEAELTATDKAQPALYALSYVLWESLSDQLSPRSAAGHSLGEYTALAAAGAFTFAEGLALVAARGKAMAEAAEAEPSGMAALIGSDPQVAEDMVRQRRDEGGRLWVANLNAPGQIVVAGGSEDIVWVTDHAKAFGIRRAVSLKVAGAFHTPFMERARVNLEQALARTHLQQPTFEVWSNFSATPTTDVEDSLAQQMTSPVRFAETLVSMVADGTEVFVHVGPGDVTAGLAKRTVPDAHVLTCNALDQIPEIVANLDLLGTMAQREET